MTFQRKKKGAGRGRCDKGKKTRSRYGVIDPQTVLFKEEQITLNIYVAMG